MKALRRMYWSSMAMTMVGQSVAYHVVSLATRRFFPRVSGATFAVSDISLGLGEVYAEVASSA